MGPTSTPRSLNFLNSSALLRPSAMELSLGLYINQKTHYAGQQKEEACPSLGHMDRPRPLLVHVSVDYFADHS